MNGRALILEGGGSRGLYTAGVLDAFLDYNIEKWLQYPCMSSQTEFSS